MERYRHTQVGWVIITSLLLAAVVLYPLLSSTESASLSVLLLFITLFMMMQFATLTVVLENRRIRFYFGIGLIRKRFDLAEVVDYRQVKNPWHYGWGIHIFPGGTLYNVSGSAALELTLTNGRRIRIGTDEPEALLRALERVIGRKKPAAQPQGATLRSPNKNTARRLLAIALLVLTVSVSIGVVFYFEEQPPQVYLNPDAFSVESLFYSESYAIREITDVALTQSIPRIRKRSNGYSAGKTLRGYFTLDILGEGKLFIEYGVSPYLVVHRGTDFVIVNFEDPNVTLNLYEKLKAILSEASQQIER